MHKEWLTRGVLALTACAVLGMLFWPREQAVRVKTATIERRTIEDCVMGSGVVGRRDTSLIASQTGGRVAQVYVAAGEWVREGQALLRLDTSMLETSLMQAVRRAESASVETFGNSTADSLVNAQLATMQDEVETLSAQVAAQTLRAQQDGQVLYTHVKSGEVLLAGSPALTLAGAEQSISMQVGERDAARLETGLPARLLRDEKVIGTGRVASVGLPMARADGVSLADVEITPDDALELPVGSRVDVQIVRASRNAALVLPAEAFLGDDQSVWQVYGERVWPLKLKTGLQDDFGVEVLSAPVTLTVAVDAAGALEAGTRVKAVEP